MTEPEGLMAGLVTTQGPATGTRALIEWLGQKAAVVGRRYASEYRGTTVRPPRVQMMDDAGDGVSTREGRQHLAHCRVRLMGIVGGAAGFLLALVVKPFPEQPITVAAPVLAVAAPFLVAAASIAGGVLAAWFLTLVILSWAPGRFRCPRCGVANIPGAQLCHGCLLPFE